MAKRVGTINHKTSTPRSTPRSEEGSDPENNWFRVVGMEVKTNRMASNLVAREISWIPIGKIYRAPKTMTIPAAAFRTIVATMTLNTATTTSHTAVDPAVRSITGSKLADSAPEPAIPTTVEAAQAAATDPIVSTTATTEITTHLAASTVRRLGTATKVVRT